MILDHATNMFGPLSGELRARLSRVIAEPTQATWDDAYSIILNSRTLTTLWQAWVAVDPSAPRIGPVLDGEWSKIPDQVTIAHAIKHATQPENNNVIPLAEASRTTGISVNRLQRLCAAGRIRGAKRIGRMWLVPNNPKITPGTRGPKLPD